MITLSDIMSVDMPILGTIPDAELEGALARGKQILLARQRAQKASGIKAPIWKDFSPYRIKIKGLSRTEMENQFKAIRTKLSAQTTTVSGYNKWVKRQSAIFKKGVNKKLTGKQISKIWEMYEKFRELHPTLVDKFGSTRIHNTLVRDIENSPRASFSDIDESMRNWSEFVENVEYTDEQWNNM